MTPDPLRAVAERLARDVYAKFSADSPHGFAVLDNQSNAVRERAIRCVLAGLTHAARPADRTAEREAARKAWDAAARFTEDECKMPSPESFARTRDRYLAAEFDAGERVALSDGSVVTPPKNDGDLWTSVKEGRQALCSPQATYLAVTGEDFKKLKAASKRLAEQRGAER